MPIGHNSTVAPPTTDNKPNSNDSNVNIVGVKVPIMSPPSNHGHYSVDSHADGRASSQLAVLAAADKKVFGPLTPFSGWNAERWWCEEQSPIPLNARRRYKPWFHRRSSVAPCQAVCPANSKATPGSCRLRLQLRQLMALSSEAASVVWWMVEELWTSFLFCWFKFYYDLLLFVYACFICFVVCFVLFCFVFEVMFNKQSIS